MMRGAAATRPGVVLLLAALAVGRCAGGPPADAAAPLEVLAIDVVPHRFSPEIRSRVPPDPALGSLVRVILAGRGGDAATARVRVDGRSPADLLADGVLAWTDAVAGPDGTADPPGETTVALGPGEVAVLTLNGRGEDWGAGTTHRLDISDAATGAAATVAIPLVPDPVRITKIVCVPDPARPAVIEGLVIHLANDGAEPLSVEAVGLRAKPAGREVLRPAGRAGPPRLAGGAGSIPPGDRGVVRVDVGDVPLARGLVEVVVRGPSASRSVYGPIRFKPDVFDIGSGWLDVPAHRGVVPLARESFLALLSRMHVNAAHIESVAGYSDSTGPDGLATRFPLRRMGALADTARFSADAEVALVTGVDAVGEPQMGLTPRATFDKLRPYRDARYPTTLTLSADEGFRFWAGMADFPHFDAYRVSAPAPDSWRLYDRWPGGERIRWGAPLEGIGAMTRTLRETNRPAPIAAWSQNVHENWDSYGGRTRRSPTGDEIRAQAYQALANGAAGIYWYSLQSWSLAAYRDTIEATTRVGREIRMLEDLLVVADAAWHRRVDVDADRPSLDLNTLVAADAGILFALDLEYVPDPDTRTFRFPPPRAVRAEFPLPRMLLPAEDLFRVDADGVHDAPWRPTPTGVAVEGTLDRVAVWVATRDRGLRGRIADRRAALLRAEAAAGIDPAADDADYARLLRDLGIASEEELAAVSGGRSRETGPGAGGGSGNRAAGDLPPRSREE